MGSPNAGSMDQHVPKGLRLARGRRREAWGFHEALPGEWRTLAGTRAPSPQPPPFNHVTQRPALHQGIAARFGETHRERKGG